MLRRAFGTLPTGVTALAAVVDAKPVGIAVSSFTSVSLEPALALVCVSHASTTWPVLSRAPRLGVSVLSADQQRACRARRLSAEVRRTGRSPVAAQARTWPPATSSATSSATPAPAWAGGVVWPRDVRNLTSFNRNDRPKATTATGTDHKKARSMAEVKS